MKNFKHPALFLVATVLVTYGNVYGNEFLFDDEFLILKNQFLDSFGNLGRILTSSSTKGAGFDDSFYRPVQTLAYLIVNQIFGRETWAFHALNVGLHAVNATLVFALARRLRLTERAALLAALLWSVHPLHVEAVTYASATADPLHAGFTLAALLVATGIRLSPARVLIAVLLQTLALLSKESAIVLPGLLTAMIFVLADGKRWSWRSYLKTIPFWITAGGYYLVRKTILHFEDARAFFKAANPYADHLSTRAFTALATLPEYLGLLLWPHDLRMERIFPVYADVFHAPVVLGLVMVGAGLAALTAAFVTRERRYVFAGFATLWVAAAHAPHSGVVIPVNAVFLEHWMYLTALPLFLLAGVALDRAARSRLGTLLSVALVALLAQKTFRQNYAWATPITFFSRTLEYSPTSARVRHNLAIAYSERGDDDQALAQYELMIAAGTIHPQTFHNAGYVYLKRNQLPRAEAYFLKALELDSKFYPSALNLAELYAAEGRADLSARYRALARELGAPN